ncbi:hypothetical protein M404DRAFT_1003974 [Pisolithus tinctorius Marx 270]|uniref:Uncharacterized protein n=1 Tax=Pisolithus tinctorius Marx 270 TaxID=870435 RepID=A0A0C3ITR3_PISTI|nr:hypothetical protein M404DRAFT_1003974 [Pisolithus tinctorius Marx 270]
MTTLRGIVEYVASSYSSYGVRRSLTSFRTLGVLLHPQRQPCISGSLVDIPVAHSPSSLSSHSTTRHNCHAVREYLGGPSLCMKRTILMLSEQFRW